MKKDRTSGLTQFGRALYELNIDIICAKTPADPPIRPGRRVPTSIPTIRRCLTAALANRLQRCPCCTRAMDSPRQIRNL